MSSSTAELTIGIGHNSQIADMLAERDHWRQRALRAEAERDIANTKLGRISRIYQREDISARAKSIATAILVSADGSGHVQFSTAQMARIASLNDRKAVVGAIDELTTIRMVTADRPSGGKRPTLFSLLPEEVLTDAVAAYRAEKEADATEGKTNSQVSQLREKRTVDGATEGKTNSWARPQLRENPAVGRATEGKTTGLDEQLPKSAKGSPPLVPPLFPHTPLTPPYIPPTPKALTPSERPEQVDGLVAAPKSAPSWLRGSRLPEDWQPDAELFGWAREHIPAYPETVLRTETENFRDHWLSKAGKDATKVDWSRTWQKWMRKAAADYANNQLRLARLSGKPVPTAAPRLRFWWQDRAKVASMPTERWREGIAKHANGRWPVPELGPPPGHHDCVVPRTLITELRLTEIYDEHGMKRKEGSLL